MSILTELRVASLSRVTKNKFNMNLTRSMPWYYLKFNSKSSSLNKVMSRMPSVMVSFLMMNVWLSDLPRAAPTLHLILPGT